MGKTISSPDKFGLSRSLEVASVVVVGLISFSLPFLPTGLGLGRGLGTAAAGGSTLLPSEMLVPVSFLPRDFTLGGGAVVFEFELCPGLAVGVVELVAACAWSAFSFLSFS